MEMSIEIPPRILDGLAPDTRRAAPAAQRTPDRRTGSEPGLEHQVDLTVLVPCYNECGAIERVIGEIKESLAGCRSSWELLIVDDASVDGTAQYALAAGARVLQRVENGGCGASVKSGILAARGKLIAMLDGDGSYDQASLPELLRYFPDYDQVNGARTSEQGTWKPLRFAAKLVLRKLAEWISGKRIPDLNTGLKVFKREVMLDYLWVLPEGFSCVTSMTLAFLCNGHAVKYVPVRYRPRIGASKFHPIKDTAHYALTILRMVTYFRPLRIFIPLALFFGALAVAKGVYDMLESPLGLTDSDIILSVTALLIFLAGLLADLLVAQRRA